MPTTEERLVKLEQALLFGGWGEDLGERLMAVEGNLGRLLGDGVLGNVLGGPLRLPFDNLKTGSLTVAGLLGSGGSIGTAESAARVILDENGIRGYDDSTQRYELSNDGSGWLGNATNFSWTTDGVLTVKDAFR